MPQQSDLTEAEVKEFVDDWYRKLDVHAPADEVMQLLADDGLEMKFPEGVFQGHEGARKWLTDAYQRFFDEVHTMRELKAEISGPRADVQLVVNWQARIWDPPDAKSQWLGFDCLQTWVVERSPATGRPVILSYVVDRLIPMVGSSIL
jgi:SnoaL-like domain